MRLDEGMAVDVEGVDQEKVNCENRVEVEMAVTVRK